MIGSGERDQERRHRKRGHRHGVGRPLERPRAGPRRSPTAADGGEPRKHGGVDRLGEDAVGRQEHDHGELVGHHATGDPARRRRGPRQQDAGPECCRAAHPERRTSRRTSASWTDERTPSRRRKPDDAETDRRDPDERRHARACRRGQGRGARPLLRSRVGFGPAIERNTNMAPDEDDRVADRRDGRQGEATPGRGARRSSPRPPRRGAPAARRSAAGTWPAPAGRPATAGSSTRAVRSRASSRGRRSPPGARPRPARRSASARTRPPPPRPLAHRHG